MLNFQHLTERRFRIHSSRTWHIRDILDFDLCSSPHAHHTHYTCEIGSPDTAPPAAPSYLCAQNAYSFSLCVRLVVDSSGCGLNRRSRNHLRNRTRVVGGIDFRNNCSVF